MTTFNGRLPMMVPLKEFPEGFGSWEPEVRKIAALPDGHPLRTDFSNRRAYRAAVAKWRRDMLP